MRRLINSTAVLFIILIATASVNAQTLKFGHIDLQALIQVMPERATAETKYNQFQSDMQDVFDQMQNEYQQKLGELQQMGDSASEVKRNAKVTEIQGIQQRIQTYQSNAQQQLQQKQAELLNPVFGKADSVIAVVAKEKGLIYVFDASANSVILYKSNQSIDLLPLVKAKLGIQ